MPSNLRSLPIEKAFCEKRKTGSAPLFSENAWPKTTVQNLKLSCLMQKGGKKPKKNLSVTNPFPGRDFLRDVKFGTAATWKGFVFRFGGCIPFAGCGDDLQLFLDEIFCYRKIPLVDMPDPLVQPLSRFVRSSGIRSLETPNHSHTRFQFFWRNAHVSSFHAGYKTRCDSDGFCRFSLV